MGHDMAGVSHGGMIRPSFDSNVRRNGDAPWKKSSVSKNHWRSMTNAVDLAASIDEAAQSLFTEGPLARASPVGEADLPGK
jgi:hypothetical protein